MAVSENPVPRRRTARRWLINAVLAGLALGVPMTLFLVVETGGAPHPWRAVLLAYGVSAGLATGATVASTVLALALRAWTERRRPARGRAAP